MTSLFQNVFNFKFCKKTTLMIWFLKMSSIVLCCTVFVVLTQDVWKKFTSKATSTNKIGEKYSKGDYLDLDAWASCYVTKLTKMARSWLKLWGEIHQH